MPVFEFTSREVTLHVRVEADNKDDAEEDAANLMSLIAMSPNCTAAISEDGCGAFVECDDGAMPQFSRQDA